MRQLLNAGVRCGGASPTLRLLLLLATLAIAAVTAQVDPSGFVRSGKSYPTIPKEFAATTMQQKYNSNGHEVNHTCVGAYYSSFSKNKIRSDCADFPLTNRVFGGNGTVSLGSQFGTLSLGIMDFNAAPPTTTILSVSGLSQAPTCTVYSTSWLPPLAPNYLEQVQAVYRGTAPDPNVRGRNLEEWAFIALGTTAFSFFFDSEFRRFVGYSFANVGSNSSGTGQVDVAVYTQFINVWGADNADFFPDSLFNSTCYDGSVAGKQQL